MSSIVSGSSWWHCLEGFRWYSLARGSTLLGVGFEEKKKKDLHYFQLALSTSLFCYCPCKPLVAMVPYQDGMDSYPSETLSPNKVFSLYIALVVVLYHSNREVTSTATMPGLCRAGD